MENDDNKISLVDIVKFEMSPVRGNVNNLTSLDVFKFLQYYIFASVIHKIDLINCSQNIIYE